MNLNDLIFALRRLKVETGSLACSGCGHEHSCSTKGCALIRTAAEQLEVLAGIFNEKTVLTLAAQHFDTTPKRIVDLVSLYKAGGLHMPPVKVGDRVWFICWDKVAKEWVVDEESHGIEEVGTKGFFVSYDDDEPIEFDEYVLFDNIGDECFLSHEEAVAAAAVKERPEDDEFE